MLMTEGEEQTMIMLRKLFGSPRPLISWKLKVAAEQGQAVILSCNQAIIDIYECKDQTVNCLQDERREIFIANNHTKFPQFIV